MALQTSSYPPSEHSSTAQNPSQETQTYNSGSNNGFLSPKASPPLILAFLAIGFFSIAMIVTFSWRRMRYGDGMMGLGRNMRGVDRSGMDVDIGERPVLWNLWADEQTGKVASSWDHITPLSARTIPEVLIPNNTYTTDTRTPFHTYITHIRKVFRPKDDNIIKIPAEKAEPRDTRLQVAVAIVLPSEKYEEDSLDYCIGVKEVLWREE